MKSMLALGSFFLSFFFFSILFYLLLSDYTYLVYISYLAYYLRNGMAVLKACECVSFWLVLRVFKGRFVFSCANGELVHVCFKTSHFLQNLWTIL
ncbi:hypothetical protein BDV30DRAFT_29774 [Aspergillus minisclerotigenes]|uniref:Uncharacterized protein n=1 Tax=Aspergillus minisclerotigenes TaxID=656917 RepID=A0A5N6IMY2_9EURO|nr:hypothetical protein BDV30DRAFT_29774 [Aspergillus minisclerotigenes]